MPHTRKLNKVNSQVCLTFSLHRKTFDVLAAAAVAAHVSLQDYLVCAAWEKVGDEARAEVTLQNLLSQRRMNFVLTAFVVGGQDSPLTNE